MYGMDYGKTALLSVISVAKKTISLDERVTALENENQKLKTDKEVLRIENELMNKRIAKLESSIA